MELDGFGDSDSWWDEGEHQVEHHTDHLGLNSNPTNRNPLKELTSAEKMLEEGVVSHEDEFGGLEFSDEEDEGEGGGVVQAEAEPAFDFDDDNIHSDLPPPVVGVVEPDLEVLIDSSDTDFDSVPGPADPAELDELTFSDEEQDTPAHLTTTDPSPQNSQQSTSSAKTSSSNRSIPRKRSSLGPLDLNSLDRALPSSPSLTRHPSVTNPNKQLRLSPVDPVQAEMDKFFGFLAPAAATPPPDDPHFLDDFALEDFSDEADDEMDEIVSAEESDAGREEAGSPLDRAGPSQPSGRVGRRPAKVKARAGDRAGWKLEPVGSKCTVKGGEWEVDDKRLAIIARLEQLVLAILRQLANNAELLAAASDPPDNDGPPSSQASAASDPKPRKPKLVPKPQRVVILMAGRDAVGEGEQPKLRRRSWPRKSGQGENVACGGKELAAFVKVIELVLDGLRSNTVSTKRELYYRDPKLFERQAVVDGTLDDLAAGLGVRRAELNVVAASKGLFSGALTIETTDGLVLEGGEQGALTPPAQRIANLDCAEAEWVLVVEKEAVFQTLCRPDFLSEGPIGPGILLTGKGYPDLATRELLHRLDGTLDSAVPLLALVDSDPHGLHILWTYTFGSTALKFDADNLRVPRLEWAGVKGTEWEAMGVKEEDLIELKEGDRKHARAMLRRDNLPDEWRRELDFMLEVDRKAEIEVLSSAIASAEADSPPASQRSQALPWIPLESQLPLDSQSSASIGQRAPSQLMRYLFDKIGARLEAGAGTSAE